MFSSFRGRFGIPGAISVVALVFAMIGGAYAASDDSGSGHRASASAAKKGPPGPRGKRGKPGPAGPVGPAGPAGQPGPVGAKGDMGPEGKQGPKGEKGAKGFEGEEGAPWTAGGTLPKGATETGSWLARTDAEAAPNIFEGKTAVSFFLPLSAEPTPVLVEKGETPVKAECDDGEEPPVSPEHPEAASGFLCIFFVERNSSPPTGFPPAFVLKSGAPQFIGASPTGAVIQVLNTANEVVWGTFAVTG